MACTVLVMPMVTARGLLEAVPEDELVDELLGWAGAQLTIASAISAACKLKVRRMSRMAASVCPSTGHSSVAAGRSRDLSVPDLDRDWVVVGGLRQAMQGEVV